MIYTEDIYEYIKVSIPSGAIRRIGYVCVYIYMYTHM